NASLSERAHGMAESTLRRHLAALVNAGLILRRDSPNGKRYARRAPSGAMDRAFGFDLRPLLVQAPQIMAQADAARAAGHELRGLREAVVIGLRDLMKLLIWATEQVTGDWGPLLLRCGDLQRKLRRKLEIDVLTEMQCEITGLSTRLQILMPAQNPADNTTETTEMDGSDAQNERHYQNSDKDYLESEQSAENKKKQIVSPIPLGLVLKAAPDILDYAPDGIGNWRELVVTAAFVSPMLGISADGWRNACQIMGDEVAATTLACILQRSPSIFKPGGYLRSLTAKAQDEGFSPAPMVMALIRAENSRAL
ncbi:MAG: replication initiation protein, partial [Paracoccus sp. (in: a-proteobacteria)]|nr:replication initiation protein [Paracoccus sp. (in: a-proteobacteria)]